MNCDFAEMLKLLAAENVEYLVVGGYAVAAHGVPRATGDIDLWVRPTEENAARLWRALDRFGAPRSRLSPASFTQPDMVAVSAHLLSTPRARRTCRPAGVDAS
jgi:hypothetical protein